jgi:hypothetical protein
MKKQYLLQQLRDFYMMVQNENQENLYRFDEIRDLPSVLSKIMIHFSVLHDILVIFVKCSVKNIAC